MPELPIRRFQLDSGLDKSNIENRTVAFIDILGFRNLVKDYPLQELVKKYVSMVQVTDAMNRPLQLNGSVPSLFPDHGQNEPWCQRYIFSDSIILISNGNDDRSCFKLLVYTWRLLQMLLAMKFPARGGIYCDELYENRQMNLILGRALTGAYTLERQQQWIGMAVDNTVVASHPVLFSSFEAIDVLGHLLFLYPVPFKDGTRNTLHTLNWRFNLLVQKGTRSLFSQSAEPSIREKVQNTLEYARAIIASGKVYIRNQETLPVELRSFYIGDSQAPFSHGDDL
jgi:hypothetical protein